MLSVAIRAHDPRGPRRVEVSAEPANHAPAALARVNHVRDIERRFVPLDPVQRRVETGKGGRRVSIVSHF